MLHTHDITQTAILAKGVGSIPNENMRPAAGQAQQPNDE